MLSPFVNFNSCRSWLNQEHLMDLILLLRWDLTYYGWKKE